jgi:hypothetical protein
MQVNDSLHSEANVPEGLHLIQADIDRVISDIQSLPKQKRKKIYEDINTDFRSWILATFETPFAERNLIESWPKPLAQYVAHYIATSLYYPRFVLTVRAPNFNDLKDGCRQNFMSKSHMSEEGKRYVYRRVEWAPAP